MVGQLYSGRWGRTTAWCKRVAAIRVWPAFSTTWCGEWLAVSRLAASGRTLLSQGGGSPLVSVFKVRPSLAPPPHAIDLTNTGSFLQKLARRARVWGGSNAVGAQEGAEFGGDRCAVAEAVAAAA
jgi:hypothetical protein